VNGQLGNGTFTSSNVAVAVVNLNGVIDIAAGSGFSCALRSAGTVACWGDNFNGALGNGAVLPPPPTADDPPPPPMKENTPQNVVGLAGATAIDTGSEHACAIAVSGTGFCWGLNNAGQLGDGTTTRNSTPQSVSGVVSMSRVATGESSSCAIKWDGSAMCWGGNARGQLGTGDQVSSTMPLTVIQL
jgi:hypothetical protein